jgi:hypothetical protein
MEKVKLFAAYVEDGGKKNTDDLVNISEIYDP